MNTDIMFSSNSDEYQTPDILYNNLNAKHHFTLDPCCTHENAKCKKHYTKEEDGLKQDWSGEVVFVNPPYSNVKDWVKKCYDENQNGTKIVMLIPARTDTKWFHNYIYNNDNADYIF